MSKTALARNRKMIIIGAVVITVLAAGGAGWFVLQNKKPTVTEHSHDVTASDISDVTLEARRYIEREDAKGGAVYYDEQVAKAHDPAVIQPLLIAKVDYLLQVNDPAAAVESAKKAVAVNADDAFGHAALARAYEANGQRKEALAEYKTALARLPEGGVVGRNNPRADFEAKIQELEA